MKKHIVLFLGLFMSTSVLADTCDQTLLTNAQNGQKQKLQEEADRATKVYKPLMKQPDWLKDSDGLLTACMSANWPTLKLSQPVLQSILSKAQEKATKAACNKARDVVSDATGNAQDLLSELNGISSSSNLGKWSDIGELGTTALTNVTNGSTSSSTWSDVISGISNSTGTTSGTSIPGITP